MSVSEDDLYLDHDTTEEALAAQLPSFMPKDPESGNYRLLSTLAERIAHTKSDLKDVDRAATVQHADTIDQLDRLSRLVDLKPRRNEGREHYRARLISEFQLVTSEGTIQDLLNGTSTILDTSKSNISYTEQHSSEPGVCQVGVPGSRLDALQLSDSEFATILNDLVPSSFRVDVLRQGTFTYITPTTHNSGNHQTWKGYDGLDADGNAKDNGGTYAGLLD